MYIQSLIFSNTITRCIMCAHFLFCSIRKFYRVLFQHDCQVKAIVTEIIWLNCLILMLFFTLHVCLRIIYHTLNQNGHTHFYNALYFQFYNSVIFLDVLFFSLKLTMTMVLWSTFILTHFKVRYEPYLDQHLIA